MKINHASMQQANEAAILDHVRRNGGLSRARVASDLGLSPATVSRAVRRLLHVGALHEVGSSTPSLGRPATLLEYNPRQGFVVAVDVGGSMCRVALADLEGEVLYSDHVPTHQAGRETLEVVIDSIDAALQRAAGLPAGVTALGVAVPGVVGQRGTVSRAPNVGWEDVSVGELLHQRFRIPVIVENDVNLAALGEAWRGAAHGIDDFVVVSIGTGIGAGIVVGGELLQGRHNAAGEIGYLVPGTNYLATSPGGQGWFEALASGPALAARAAEMLGQSTSVSGPHEVKTLRAEDVFRLYHAGDRLACTVIEELIDRVALLVTSISVILDPETIIFGGSVGVALEGVLDVVTERIVGLIPVLPTLKVSNLRGQATLLGAVSAALALSRAGKRGRAELAAQTRSFPDASMTLAVRSLAAQSSG